MYIMKSIGERTVLVVILFGGNSECFFSKFDKLEVIVKEVPVVPFFKYTKYQFQKGASDELLETTSGDRKSWLNNVRDHLFHP